MLLICIFKDLYINIIFLPPSPSNCFPRPIPSPSHLSPPWHSSHRLPRSLIPALPFSLSSFALACVPACLRYRSVCCCSPAVLLSCIPTCRHSCLFALLLAGVPTCLHPHSPASLLPYVSTCMSSRSQLFTLFCVPASILKKFPVHLHNLQSVTNNIARPNEKN